jgi:uridine kinase
MKIYVHADSDERLIRRMKRDIVEGHAYARGNQPVPKHTQTHARTVY